VLCPAKKSHNQVSYVHDLAQELCKVLDGGNGQSGSCQTDPGGNESCTSPLGESTSDLRHSSISKGIFQ